MFSQIGPEGDGMSTKRLFVHIPAELHRRLKIIAAKTGTSISELVREALRRMMEEIDEQRGS